LNIECQGRREFSGTKSHTIRSTADEERGRRRRRRRKNNI